MAYTGPFPHTVPAATTTSAIQVVNTTFTGNITNNGNIEPGGISLADSTIDGQIIDAAGSSSLFAAMLSSIAIDGPIATAAAFIGVVLTVVLLFRRASSIALSEVRSSAAGAPGGSPPSSQRRD